MTLTEQREAAVRGVSAAVLASIEHICVLEDGHADPCACACGASR